jgi:hypothetical protein
MSSTETHSRYKSLHFISFHFILSRGTTETCSVDKEVKREIRTISEPILMFIEFGN